MNATRTPDDPVADLLTDTLRARADATERPDTDALTDALLPRAHRSAGRRRTALASVTVAVVAAVVATGWWGLRSATAPMPAQSPTVASTPVPSTISPSISPATPTAPSSLPGRPDASSTPVPQITDPAERQQAFDALSPGPAMDVLPRAEKVGTKVQLLIPRGADVARPVPLPSGTTAVISIDAATTGWLVVTSNASSTALLHVSPTGEITTLLTGITTKVLLDQNRDNYAVGVRQTVKGVHRAALVVRSIADVSPLGEPAVGDLDAPLTLLAWTADGIWFNAGTSVPTSLLQPDGTVRTLARQIHEMVVPKPGHSLFVMLEAVGDQHVCLTVSSHYDDASPTTLACDASFTLIDLRNGQVILRSSGSTLATALLHMVDYENATLDILVRPPLLGGQPLVVDTAIDGNGNILIPFDLTVGQQKWMRWSPNVGSLHRVAMPAGVDAVIAWP